MKMYAVNFYAECLDDSEATMATFNNFDAAVLYARARADEALEGYTEHYTRTERFVPGVRFDLDVNESCGNSAWTVFETDYVAAR